MYQVAEGKDHPECKKIKTAVHTIFEEKKDVPKLVSA